MFSWANPPWVWHKVESEESYIIKNTHNSITKNFINIIKSLYLGAERKGIRKTELDLSRITNLSDPNKDRHFNLILDKNQDTFPL